MGYESWSLIGFGVMGICISIVMVKCGYGRPAMEMVSKASRRAVRCVTKVIYRR
jgi:hypothetical protein